MLTDLEKTLYSQAQIQSCVQLLGQRISQDYRSQGIDRITLVAIIHGAILFAADLMRALDLHVRFDCMRVSSYQDQMRPVTEPRVLDSFHMDLRGHHVLLIDDILDTGKTLSHVSSILREAAPASLKTCVLLNKREHRSVDIEADYVGFHVPDAFVVGYGLDYSGYYRNLPVIGILSPSIYQSDTAPA
jgi:hypoxanthine phosphoribosyltransferase